MSTPAFVIGLAPTLEALQWFFLLYFVCINAVYLGLNFISMYTIVRYVREHGVSYRARTFAQYQPPVSILVPAYNEARTIVATVRSLLRLDYPNFEVVVINDGSTDDTLKTVVEEFGLVEFPEAYRARLKTAPIRRLYVSPGHGRVRLVDKDNGGKADSLNAGINTARYPLFCVVDADSILQKDSLARVVQPFLEDARMIATGGVIRVVNGCTVQDGLLKEIDLPDRLLPAIQVLEYLRAFLFGRLGWLPLNALLIISGAFGVFYKERVIAAGGYKSDLVGEDMEMVVRLHDRMREENRPYRIAYVPDPICWTEVPSDLRSLYGQRTRWQQGLAESLFGNLRLMFRRNAGAVGWLAFPFMLLFECLGPLVEVLGYVSVIILWLAGMVSMQAFWVFLFASIGLGILLSVNAMLLEEVSFQLYPRPRQQLKLFVVAILENFGYRQMLSVFCVIGLVRWMLGRSSWGHMRRKADWHEEEEEMMVSPAQTAQTSGAAAAPGKSREVTP
ncbi:glycosyltransferase family 2 protein [Thermomonas hydrothermalis]|uniref:Glycosyltransferase, catalytic subunit of cellulose synthase and poly-beta-1,6-N-acetylglucosamine synthase n=1 Tax=Thermomonas hydrothermalis TaxID=213588 RepID=A0A1M4YMH6_9GAMM|nr:glycosyltransferase [Thermomonas hydrothermalis]SHF06868.1 Glycosyltransferase, catalytic subunit of cellulose synthase and poly-beta-1,6-N-acetylglucosamine synthase [Thermomonas hydrothermalis]